MRQTTFSFFKNGKKSFGGSELVGRRKSKRPLSTKSPIHLILKSETHRIFLPSNQSLRELIFKTAAKFNVQIREYALNWTHIHFIIQIKGRNDYIRFIRALTSKLAMAVAKAQAGTKAQAESRKLFTLRPFTRIMTWGRDYKSTIHYMFVNFKESLGVSRKDVKAADGGKKEGLWPKKKERVRRSEP